MLKLIERLIARIEAALVVPYPIMGSSLHKADPPTEYDAAYVSQARKPLPLDDE